MKKIILSLASKLFYKPLFVRYCSQTIYQVLIGCIRLYEATNKDIWLKRAHRVCIILVSTQQEDGGFDIGYEFNFGLLHKKGESTSPELVGLSALVRYYKISGNQIAAEAAHKAANWIKNNAVKVDQNKWMIPYAPRTINQVMVYNGTSFAVGALGEYLSVFPDVELDVIYHGMVVYLESVMSSDQHGLGKFWFYSDQMRDDLSEEALNKIDYYHQMQQVEAHCESQFVKPTDEQRRIIASASIHVSSKQEDDGKIPYLNKRTDIHLWGYCSCASGFLLAGKVVEDMNEEFRNRARLIYAWIEKYSWNGKYFFPIVSHRNQIVDNSFYVRSDAWVFNSFALAVKENIEYDKYYSICELSYQAMSAADFSGPENHASNRSKRLYIYVLNSLGKIKRTLWRK
ncbi:hypothetical protein [Algoriphagus litoralis]|uniref:hypothetical protein n=1 Tax=Algoriphagus litoralis TaxID=2202829 RepID=UPI000DBACBD1|nr:hypothetical protein [Algoriphagus litoralis]